LNQSFVSFAEIVTLAVGPGYTRNSSTPLFCFPDGACKVLAIAGEMATSLHSHTASSSLPSYTQGQAVKVTVTGSTGGAVVGGPIYSLNSSLSTAAVHAGVVAVNETTEVVVLFLGPQPGLSGYPQTFGFLGANSSQLDSSAADFKLNACTGISGKEVSQIIARMPSPIPCLLY
jgi:hypothetical protein